MVDGSSPRGSGRTGRSARWTTWLLVGSFAGVLGCSDGDPAADEPTEWPRTLPSLLEQGERRGLRLVRSIIHAHSPVSHDACDYEGWVDGALADPQCLENLRHAVCVLHIDALLLTDHSPHVDAVGFEQALWLDAVRGDEPVTEGGALVASRMACPEGHTALVTVGSENRLMPINLRRHPLEGATPEERYAAYNADGPEAVEVFREAGAAVLVPHTESRSLEYLQDIGVDGVEIYNTHANVDPNIRSQWLGLDSWSYVEPLLKFAFAANDLAPDLAILAFLSENQNALDKWDALLAEGQRLTGLGGGDAHENTLPNLLSDGERGDSYRRMMRWFSNHLLVNDLDIDAVNQAVRVGRMYVAFEAFGTPEGFDFVATQGTETVEMGGEAAVGATLRVTRPGLPDGHPAVPAPELTLRILRSSPTGGEVVAEGDGETLEYLAAEAGAYRAEVRMVPHHARPFLAAEADALVREVPWIYSNPVYVF
jgi:hypothetical protein